MRSITHYGTTIVLLHAVIVALHGLAHDKIPVHLSSLQSLFVGSTIVVAPIAAMILLWTPFQQTGSWLLLSSMAGAMLFGLYHHFIASGTDRIYQIPFAGWGVLFDITAIFLFLTEGLGCVIGAWAVSTLRRREQFL
ncbi:hypothetical protein BV372_27890 [Nostoc sp. T09]|uniref:hypothetical protein n=1 Tax=Nostoc sp. T09 TaxID=1932621 RepID=UPI000A3ADB4C|nr:hypothetical protein [Nostoc sp. T09]OUL25496.1 hypothetical protein BV372_27890 [Nostoc sp. T09]